MNDGDDELGLRKSCLESRGTLEQATTVASWGWACGGTWKSPPKSRLGKRVVVTMMMLYTNDGLDESLQRPFETT
jgi:hypothetical protein